MPAAVPVRGRVIRVGTNGATASPGGCSRPGPCSRVKPLANTGSAGWWWSTGWRRLVQLGIRQSRYFGRIKTRQLYLAATVANLTLVAGRVDG